MGVSRRPEIGASDEEILAYGKALRDLRQGTGIRQEH
jgi:hypothetical protein